MNFVLLVWIELAMLGVIVSWVLSKIVAQLICSFFNRR